MKNKNFFRYVFLFCFCISIFILQAQNKLDSLQKALHQVKEDTAKVNTMNAIAMELRYNNPDSAIYFAGEAVSLSEKINYKIGIGEAYVWGGTALFNLGKYNEALSQFSRAQVLFVQLLTASKRDTKRIKKLFARSYNNIGLVHHNRGNYRDALANHLIALKMRKEIEDKQGQANSYINIGNVYFEQGNYPDALRNYFLAMKIQVESKDRSGEAASYNNIGNIYHNQGDFNKALKNHLISLKIKKEIGDKIGESASYNNIANVYLEQRNFAESLKNNLASLAIQREVKNQRGEADSYFNIGLTNLEQYNYTEALKNFFVALRIQEEIGYKIGIAHSLSAIGMVYQRQGDFIKAIDYGKRSVTIAKEAGALLYIRDASEILFESYKKANNHKAALEMHELFVQSRDSLINEKNQKEILGQQFKYDYDKKALADSLDFVNKKNISDLKNEAEHKAERIKRYTLYAGLSLVLIFSLFILNRFRVTAKQKKVIEFQNSQIVESINYSQKIQASLLPSVSVMQKSIDNLFVFYEPKDIVSGDFYWFKEFEKYTVLACVDCTGHGVPGGFMSTLGSLLMSKIVNGTSSSPSEMLSGLSTEIIQKLHQQDGGEIQDGMDLSICLIDRVNKTIEFSGARNGIVIVTNGEAKKYKADLYPVGGNYMKKGKPIDRQFNAQKIAVDKNDWIYMYTDGFVEQSGGDKGLPMNYTQFESHLIAISNNIGPEEKINILRTQIDNWRGEYERNDDVLIMGFQVI